MHGHQYFQVEINKKINQSRDIFFFGMKALTHTANTYIEHFLLNKIVYFGEGLNISLSLIFLHRITVNSVGLILGEKHDFVWNA